MTFLLLKAIGINKDFLTGKTNKQIWLLLFESMLLIFLRTSLLISTLSTSSNNLPQTTNIGLPSKIITGLLIVSFVYFLIDRPTILSIRRKKTAPWSSYIALLIPIKFITSYLIALLLQNLFYGPIDINNPTNHTWAAPVLTFFLFLELVPIFIEFYLDIELLPSEKGNKSVKGAKAKPQQPLVEEISKNKKEAWIGKIAKANTSTVLDEMLKDSIIKADKNIYSEIINLSSRWSLIEDERQKGLEDAEKLFKHINNINLSLIKIIDKV